MTTTFEQIRTLMGKEFGLAPADIQPETELATLGVDSLAALEFAFDLEEAFGIILDPATDLRGATVQDVVAAVEHATRHEPEAAAG